MHISVEIIYYPLHADYNNAIEVFAEKLLAYQQLSCTTGPMSTIIAGEYSQVFQALSEAIKPMMEKYPSVFSLKMANACPV